MFLEHSILAQFWKLKVPNLGSKADKIYIYIYINKHIHNIDKITFLIQFKPIPSLAQQLIACSWNTIKRRLNWGSIINITCSYFKQIKSSSLKNWCLWMKPNQKKKKLRVHCPSFAIWNKEKPVRRKILIIIFGRLVVSMILCNFLGVAFIPVQPLPIFSKLLIQLHVLVAPGLMLLYNINS